MARMQPTADQPDDSPATAAAETSQSGLDRLFACVLAEAPLQQELAALDSSDEFVARAVEAARRRGIGLDARTIETAMTAPNSGAGAGGGDAPPAGWLPVATRWRNGVLALRWSYFGEARLRAPFFAMDVRSTVGKPFNRLVRPESAVDRLLHRPHAPALAQPSGLIFHMSRCGSTLVAQMLAACADNVVISEAAPIDDVVRACQVRPGLSEEEQARWLSAIVGALGGPRAGERRLFVKLDCWHTLAFPLFRRAFPDVPWVFLYRDPVEVLVSQRRMPGLQMIPGALGRPELDGIPPSHDRPEDYRARVLARICEPVAHQHARGGGLLVNYRDLPQALWTTILPHFGIEPSPEERAAMAKTAKYDAKMPGFEFTPDAAARRHAAEPATRAAAAEWLADIYARLEALRLGA